MRAAAKGREDEKKEGTEREGRKKGKKGKQEKGEKSRNTQRRAGDDEGLKNDIHRGGQSEGSPSPSLPPRNAQRKPEMKMEMPTAMTMQIAWGRAVGEENEKMANARAE